MQETEIAIIGAGIIGLAIASEISEKSKNIVVLEKNDSYGQEISSRNSEVIHAGIYYPSHFLKTRLCIEGNELIYQACKEHNISHKKTGKLIIAKNKGEIKALENLLQNGINNGVKDLSILNKNELRQKEPKVNALAALFSPNTGILDTHGFMKFLERSAETHGVIFAYRCKVENIEKFSGGYKIIVKQNDEISELISRVVINCAGLFSDKIAGLLGINEYKIHYCKGEYFKVNPSKGNFLNHLIYPSPKNISLGIHTVIDLAGDIKLGPNAFYVDEVDYEVDENHKKDFINSVKDTLPFIEENDLEPDMAGIRPKLQLPNEPARDFIIKNEYEKGFPNFINLIGIESPGFTASLSIAKYVSKLTNLFNSL